MTDNDRWTPTVVDHEVVMEQELTDAQRIDRLELIVADMSLHVTASFGSRARSTAAIRHLLVERGWLRG